MPLVKRKVSMIKNPEKKIILRHPLQLNMERFLLVLKKFVEHWLNMLEDTPKS